jgi:hypothetical protein
MTRPDSPNNHNMPASVTDQWRSRWLVPLAPAALGAVVLLAAVMAGRILTGVLWFAVISAIGALSPIAARLQAARRGRCHDQDEREAIINARAMSIAGTVLVIVITGCAAFTLARGESTSPYTALLAVGGISYAVGLLPLRYEKP